MLHHCCQFQPTRDQPHSVVGDFGKIFRRNRDKQPCSSVPHSNNVVIASSTALIFARCPFTSSASTSPIVSATSEMSPTSRMPCTTIACLSISTGMFIAAQTSTQSLIFSIVPGLVSLVRYPFRTSSSMEPSGVTTFFSPSSPRTAYRGSVSSNAFHEEDLSMLALDAALGEGSAESAGDVGIGGGVFVIGAFARGALTAGDLEIKALVIGAFTAGSFTMGAFAGCFAIRPLAGGCFDIVTLTAGVFVIGALLGGGPFCGGAFCGGPLAGEALAVLFNGSAPAGCEVAFRFHGGALVSSAAIAH
mmetsp:Transcript_159913/g.298275  ORF Transcript_159913/g.298275 Transcript_159913/m.298275 type:complete len:304 (-) Transcript_159913:88-999(-)